MQSRYKSAHLHKKRMTGKSIWLGVILFCNIGVVRLRKLYFMSKSTMIGRWSEGRQKFERFWGSRIGVVYSSQMMSA